MLQMPVGAGGVGGVCGPRTGNSSGVWPGSSSGRCSSASAIPSLTMTCCGFSGGVSVGCPGWVGGSSGGSIGIPSPLSSTVADGLTAAAKRCSRGKAFGGRDLATHQHGVAAIPAGLRITARLHVGETVVMPLVARQMFDHHRTRPQAFRGLRKKAGEDAVLISLHVDLQRVDMVDR